METRTDTLTYAGAQDDSFDAYSDVIRHTPIAVVAPLLYQNHPEAGGDMSPDLQADGQYFGTIGAFHATIAVNTPSGPWSNDYTGNLPIEQQPHLPNTEPWLMPEGI
ncbi:MAG TPA: hypothetical protein VGO07_03760 [Candidatus Saccharimonadales bacterium]|jgi:hypothetical protein|nr:hypothetical protein [Candidatus Saccharimonadales bacterium]